MLDEIEWYQIIARFVYLFLGMAVGYFSAVAMGCN